MFKFYLRQTVPFKFVDFIHINDLFLNKSFRSVGFTEKNIKNKIGTKYAVITDSLRTGLTKSLQYFTNKYHYKNEVILPEYSFYSNLNSVLNLNLKVIYAPIDQKTLELDLNKLPKYINNKTLAIIITHMHGLSYDMDKLNSLIEKNKIVLFEDCAHVFGEKYKNKLLGSFGIGCFSFGSGKNVTSFGGGSVCTNDQNLYRFLKNNQIQTKNIIEEIKTYIVSLMYTTISHPLFSFILVKPILKLIYVSRFEKNNHDNIKINKKITEQILTPNRFQLSILNYQLTKISKRIEDIYNQRKTIASIYSKYFYKNNIKAKYNYYFQYPIHVNNKREIILKGLKNNIDVQPDYCSYLPNLYKSNKVNSKFNNDIVYLPVNYHMSNQNIISMLNKIFTK